MDTQLKIERLVELALLQRTELKELVEQLPQMRQFLTDEIEKNLEVIEPQLRSELEEFAKNKSGELADSIEINLTEKVDELLRNLERTTAAKYSVLLAEKNKTKEIEQQAKDLIAAAAIEIPSKVKSIVLDELSRFPRAGEIDQLRKEFAEPKGLNPRGKWQASERYQRLDLVAYNGDSYVSNTDDNKDKPSRNTSAWTLSAARGTGGGGGGVTSILDLVGASTDGQLLIGSNGDFAKATLTAGSGVTIANAPGSITISATGGGGGSGTVTSVSVTTANGVSGTVATSTTTPAISLTLGAITPTTVNAVTLSGSSTPALAVTGTSAISGTNTGDQTITLTGDVTGSGTGSFVTAIGSGVIVNADINASAAIVDTKLATISTASKVSNSATTAASANTASAIVARDASGNFTAGTITAALTGNASTATLASSATVLATARTINGTSFDGSANITVTAAGSTLSDTVTIAKGGTGQTTANNALNALLPSQVGASGKVLQSDGTNTSFVAAGGSGTVTSVSVTTANGVSGTVATSTTTPAISLTLGAIVPTSVNSVVVSGSSTPTLAVTGTTSVSGANTGDQTITLTGGVTGSGSGSFAATVVTNANLTGGVTSVGNAATVVTNANLTGGVTSVGNAATVVTNANLTGGVTSVGNAATVITNANLTGGVTSIGNAATVVTNANLTGVITSVGNATSIAAQTGTGSTFVVSTSPTITTPVIAQINDASTNATLKLASIASAVNQITIENSATGNPVHLRATGSDTSVGLHLVAKGASGYVNVNDSVDETKRVMFNASGGATNTRTMLSSTQTVDRTLSLPDATDTLVGKATTDTLTNKSIDLANNTVTATSAQLATAVSDETGSGSLVFATSPTLVTPALGTPSALVGTNISGTAAGLTAGSVTTNANLTGDVTSVGNATAIAAGVIVNADINASAAISDTKLDTIATALKVSNSATTAASANTASAIVARDASGNFTAGTITANLTGNASGSSGSTTGNAATATVLATPRAINGVSFDGSAAITVTAAGSTLSDTVTVVKGGTGATTLTANNVLLGNGTSAVQFVAPGTTGNVLTSNGTTWSSNAPSGGGISSAGATITTNTTLTAASPGYQPIAMTALGKSVTLPDATTVSVGSPKFYLNNASGAYPVGIRNTSGTLLMAIAAGGTAFVSCQDITTAAGVWNITGDNLEPGLITIDSTFSSTYLATRLLPFVAFDSNKSLHFLELSSGFAAVAVDNTTGAVGTPVTVSAAASYLPKSAFMITSTTAIVFYGVSNGNLIGVVISLSGATTLTVGTPSSTLTDLRVGDDNFSGAPKIAQLAATLYLVSWATDNGAGNTSVAAFQVSGGTTVTLGSAVNIIAADNVSNCTTTYGLTATTGLVIYLSGAATPYTISAVVVSVTNANPPVCTVATPTAGGTRSSGTSVASCLLSATKALIAPDTNDTIVGAQAFTISGTTVTVGAVLTIETVATASVFLQYVSSTVTRTRYNPVLFPLSASTALFSYIPSTACVSRSVILTESAGTVTAGTILFNSISVAANNASNGGIIGEQGTSDFLAIRNQGNASPYTRNAVPHKISGTTITTGNAMLLEKLAVSSSISNVFGTRLSSGDYLLSPTNSDASELTVVRTNGDAINYRQTIKMPFGGGGGFAYPFPKVSSNRIVLIGRPFGSTINAASTFQLRLVNIEIAA